MCRNLILDQSYTTVERFDDMQKMLSKLNINEEGTITSIALEEIKYFKVMHLGLIKNARIKCVFKSPLQDPIAYQIKGCTFALRSEDASKIMVEI